MAITIENYQPLVSVIVPVYNNSELLRKCLAALENQTYSRELYEVVVVDNASEEDINGVVTDFERSRLTYESKPGSYVARNKGISVAKGEVIAFTDSDCIPAKDWIEKGVAHLFKVDNCGLVAGKIEFFFHNLDNPTAIEFYDSFGINQKKYVGENFGATANVFTFATVVEKVGLFNSKLKSNGDREWGNRVFASGYQISYADEVRVKHPARDSWKQLYKKAIRIIGGKYDLAKEQNRLSDATWELPKLLKPPVRFFLGRLADKRLKGNQKLMFVLVTFFVNYSQAWELIRLLIGGTSKKE